MRVLRSIVLLAFLAGCGGTAPEWAGNWQTTPPPALPGSYFSMTLSGSGTFVTGSGAEHREAGTPTDFTVSGTPTAMTFTYADNSTESFTVSQPDPDHLNLTSSAHALGFIRPLGE
jgi:hypothetical protein